MFRMLLLILTLAWAASAQATATLAELAPAYQAAPFAERVTARLSDELGSSTQSIVVRGEPGRVASVEFSGLRATLTRELLAVERVGDADRVFIAPVRTTPAETFAEHLAGVPAPQVALLFAEPDRAGWPFSAPGARASVYPNAEGRLRYATVELKGGRRVRLSVEALDASTPIEPVSVADRTRGERVRDLLEPSREAAPALVGPGDDAPAILLLGIDMSPWILASRDAGAVALVLCRRETPGASAGFGAALDVSEREDAPLGYTVALGVCVEPFDRPLLDHLRELRNRWGQLVKWTVSPETTIDRFSPNADAVLVVIDALDTVRAVIELDGRGADQPELVEEIVAALEG